ncbi:hypothetical protein KO481_36410 [Nocardia sp. NEAU-G5]|uniref:DUF2631 domain-containing protein n=1 Tax=Nocardia albiluteola TaxID=2842303 RepID=A0ABS6BB48_9NOCA|nr:hypothetical protein [Nocardia albiluteola]MBU3066991.1 hypothetical protein [Nocardia albiluteola]
MPKMAGVTRFLIGGHAFGFWGWKGFAALILVLAVGAGIYHWVDLPVMHNFASQHGEIRRETQSRNGFVSPEDIGVQDEAATWNYFDDLADTGPELD